MTAFALAFDTLFADPNIGRDAAYRIGDIGPDIPIRIILRRPDEIGTFGETRIVAETVVIDAQVSEVAAPAEGDIFTIGSETFVVQGEPVCDAESLVWTIEARPT